MNFKGITTLLLKELYRLKDIWKQAIFAPAVSNLLFLLVFGVAIAERGVFLEGHSYLTALIPGLAAMGLMMNSLQNPIFSIVNEIVPNVQWVFELPFLGLHPFR